jgi:hypothetical protein
MSIDKKISYVEQDGSLNFIKNSKSVTVPKRFKARKNAPATKLAYITDAEAKMLKKMKKGTPHKGPKGIPSYDSFGSIDASGKDTGVAGSRVSAAESGDFTGFQGTGGGPQLPPGVKRKPSKEAQDLRSAFIAAGGGQRVNPGFFDSRISNLGLFEPSVNPDYYLDQDNDDLLSITSTPKTVAPMVVNNQKTPLSIFDNQVAPMGVKPNQGIIEALATATVPEIMADYTNQLERGEPITDDEQIFIDNEIANLRFP